MLFYLHLLLVKQLLIYHQLLQHQLWEYNKRKRKNERKIENLLKQIVGKFLAFIVSFQKFTYCFVEHG